MSRIRVGMMVRVVAHHGWGRQDMKWTIGKVGKVLSPSNVYQDHWRVEGLEIDPNDGISMHFYDESLEPINPDSEPSTWEEVESITGWFPRETA